jgi:phosphocarrier protein
MIADFPQGCEVELAISDNAVDDALGRKKAEDALRHLGRLLEAQADS